MYRSIKQLKMYNICMWQTKTDIFKNQMNKERKMKNWKKEEGANYFQTENTKAWHSLLSFKQIIVGIKLQVISLSNNQK